MVKGEIGMLLSDCFIGELIVIISSVSVLFVALAISRIKPFIYLDEFLAGRWEGSMNPENEDVAGEQKDHEIKCTLIVSKHKNRRNTAYLLYERLCLGKDRLSISQGVDELKDYGGKRHHFREKQVSANFERVFHKHKTDIDVVTRSRYEFSFTIESIFFKPKMRVRVKHHDGIWWKGTWEKV